MSTLCVTNILEGMEDRKELFGRFGRVARVCVGGDRETGIGRSYAFVRFEDKEADENAGGRTPSMNFGIPTKLIQSGPILRVHSSSKPGSRSF
ncbi:translation initiation factor eIF3 subunit g [Tulasnella sp. JGI-2019a]|nr:translation initiation factor eIF3 subunit g [Tulasnella sp. JGI-2019a]